MSFEEAPRGTENRHHPERRSYTGAFVAVFMLLALLFVSNLYTLSNLNSARLSLTGLQHDLYKRIATIQSMDDRLAAQFSLVEDRHSEQMNALNKELDRAARQLGASSGQVLDRARGMVVHLQTEQQRQVDDLKKQIAQKADSEAVVLLNHDVSEAKANASTTQRTVPVLAKDLAVARSELGDLVATDRDDLGDAYEGPEADRRWHRAYSQAHGPEATPLQSRPDRERSTDPEPESESRPANYLLCRRHETALRTSDHGSRRRYRQGVH